MWRGGTGDSWTTVVVVATMVLMNRAPMLDGQTQYIKERNEMEEAPFTPNYHIHDCSGSFYLYKVKYTKTGGLVSPDDEVLHEIEVTKRGIIEDTLPLHYDVHINMTSSKSADVDVKARFAVLRRAHHIIIHMDLFRDQHVADAKLYASKPPYEPRRRCIRKMSYDDVKRLVLIHFTDDLHEGRYQLDVKFHRVKASYAGYPGSTEHEANGLFYKSTAIVPRYVTYTNFALRRARSVIPCMDHPNVKATMYLRIEAEAHLAAVSNQPDIQDIVSGSRRTTTFKTTPFLPTFAFGFAVLNGFVRDDANREPDPVINLYVDGTVYINRRKEYVWIFSEVRELLRYMTTEFNIRHGIVSLNILIFDADVDFTDSHGLLIFHERFAMRNSEQSRAVLARAVFGMWFGSVASVSGWPDVCYMNGLATYLSWRYVDLSAITFRQIRHKLTASEEKGQSQPPIYHKYEHLNETYINCNVKMPMLMQMVNSYVEPSLWISVGKAILANYSYSNVPLGQWEQLIENVAGTEIAKGFVDWTKKEGLPVLCMTRVNSTSFRIRQMMRLNGTNSEASPPWNLNLAFLPGITRSESAGVDIVDMPHPEPISWLLIDSGALIPGRRVYPLATYRLFRECLMYYYTNNRTYIEDATCPSYVNLDMVSYVFDDFCYALTVGPTLIDLNETWFMTRSVFRQFMNDMDEIYFGENSIAEKLRLENSPYCTCCLIALSYWSRANATPPLNTVCEGQCKSMLYINHLHD